MKNKTLTAWTLPELLVVMVLTGLIFMAALDGADLTGRLTARLNRKLADAAGIVEGYYRTGRLFALADSLLLQDGGCCTYRRGEETAVFRQQGDKLVCTYRGSTDTLFRLLVRMELRPDSLCLVLQHRGREVALRFGLPERPEKTAAAAARRQEEKYETLLCPGTPKNEFGLETKHKVSSIWQMKNKL